MNEGKWFNNESVKAKEYSEYGLLLTRRYKINGSEGSISEYVKEGSDWKKELKEQKKDFLEIAGPSLFYADDEIINFNDYKDRTICTNISNEGKMRNQDGRMVERKDYIDVLADAAQLPFEAESFGAVFARKFRIEESKREKPAPKSTELKSDSENNEYIRKVLVEVRRVLAEDGLVVWLDLETADFKSLIDAGFKPIFYQKREYPNGRNRYQAVFQKVGEK